MVELIHRACFARHSVAWPLLIRILNLRSRFVDARDESRDECAPPLKPPALLAAPKDDAAHPSDVPSILQTLC